MKLTGQELRFAPTDLAHHLSCRHLTALETGVAVGDHKRPFLADPRLELLRHRGLEHEDAYLERLRSDGLQVEKLSDHYEEKEAVARTRELMAAGIDVIAQATLTHSRWLGRADVLLKVEAASDLGNWSYEVVDTKLAQDTKAGTVLQLCLYSHLLERAQGKRPEHAHVIKPGHLSEPESYRLDDFRAYFRLVRRQLEAAVPDSWLDRSTYPLPVPHCEVCSWWRKCKDRWQEDDHLCLVAGLGRQQEKELQSTWEISTLAELATLPVPLEQRPTRGSVETYERLHHQARLQLQARETGEPVFELLEREPDRGLARLPSPSSLDVFFDIEGDAFAGSQGREYLFGFVEAPRGADAAYSALWGFSAEEEKANFEALIDEFIGRAEADRDFHIYHYNHYEPTAFKRLSGLYGTRQDELDRLLRGERFVDLYRIVRQGVRAGVESYSIKDLEPHYEFEREMPLKTASRGLRALEKALQLGRLDALDEATHQEVEAYNRDDCLSTLHLRNWLEQLRSELIDRGETIPRPMPKSEEASDALDERLEAVEAVASPLREGVAAEREERSNEEQARWLLSHLLLWHRREDKADWWEFFRLADLDAEERLEDKGALGDLKFEKRLPPSEGPGTEKCPADLYSFPLQECDLGAGDNIYVSEDQRIGTIQELDAAKSEVTIKKAGAAKDLHPDSVFAHNQVFKDPLKSSLLRFATSVLEKGLDHQPGHFQPGADLLLRRPPRLGGQPHSPVRPAGSSILDRARHAAVAVSEHGGVLPIQGPPGAGKTYTGARMVVELVRRGKKVGISALSHKVITNFVDEVAKAGAGKDVPVRILQKVRNKSKTKRMRGIQEIKGNNKKVATKLAQSEVDIAAGTAWLWSREEMQDSVDVLVVDEAGQMSLATALAVAPAARALILIGDPQQLQQPLKASHPEGTEVSALDHLLGEHRTLPADRGLFLEDTWRLHPEICRFTSEQFYDGKLRSRPELEQQALRTPGGIPGVSPKRGSGELQRGLFLLPCAHEGNRNRSSEEAEMARDLVDSFLGGGAVWINQRGEETLLTLDDILVVAPYNAHVAELSEALPEGARVGTVDKFQGQEAPVVLYSMATSTPEEAPRGLDFLYSRHRLNVATSRARCACFVLCSPNLLEPECKSPQQMRLANSLCRYAELSEPQSPRYGESGALA